SNTGRKNALESTVILKYGCCFTRVCNTGTVIATSPIAESLMTSIRAPSCLSAASARGTLLFPATAGRVFVSDFSIGNIFYPGPGHKSLLIFYSDTVRGSALHRYTSSSACILSCTYLPPLYP